MKKLDKVQRGFLKFVSVIVLLVITGVALKEEDMIRNSDMTIIIVLLVVEVISLFLLEKDEKNKRN